MLITLCYTFIGGLIIYFIEKIIMKKKATDLCRFHKNVGIINLCLVVFFLILYLISPDLFSDDVRISNQFIYICFSLLAGYYYILAAPLSVGNLLIIQKKEIKNRVPLFINALSIILLVISFSLFL